MIVTPITEYDSEGIKLRLTIGKEYEVLAIEGDYYRILTDPDSQPYGNDPVLFESSCFNVIENGEPEFWVTEYFDGEKYCNPFVWAQYFFEEFHDGNKQIKEEFMGHLKRYYPRTWGERYGS